MDETKRKTISNAERLGQRKRAAQAVRGGDDPATVARRYKRSLRWVQLGCQENGVHFPTEANPSRTRRSSGDVLRTYSKIIQGLPATAIAEAIGCSRQRVYEIVKEARRLRLPLGRWEK